MWLNLNITEWRRLVPPGAGCSLLCHAPLQSTASAAQTNCAVTVMHGYYIINKLYGSQTFYGMKALYLLKLELGFELREIYYLHSK